MLIKSKDNQTIKDIKKLKEKKYRKNKFIVEGFKMIEEAINENADIELIVYNESFKKEHEFVSLSEQLKKLNVNYIEVTDNIFGMLTEVVTPQGILAVIRKNDSEQKIDYNQNYFIALDGIQDPGNLGTIIRTLDAAGIKQLLVSKETVDCYGPKVIRSTMGAIFRVKIIEIEDLTQTLKDMKKDYKIITTTLDSDKSIYNINYNRTIVVIGNEANGVSNVIQNIADEKVKIPMLGKAESLNAAVATGIMVYEYVRQNI